MTKPQLTLLAQLMVRNLKVVHQKNFPLVMGSNSMIPGFEEAIIGKKIGDEFSINVTFPEDYFKKDLAGKATKFETKLLKVEEKIKSQS